MKHKLFEQTLKITSELNRKIALDVIEAEISHKIFDELIEKEKERLTITIIIEIDE